MASEQAFRPIGGKYSEEFHKISDKPFGNLKKNSSPEELRKIVDVAPFLPFSACRFYGFPEYLKQEPEKLDKYASACPHVYELSDVFSTFLNTDIAEPKNEHTHIGTHILTDKKTNKSLVTTVHRLESENGIAYYVKQFGPDSLLDVFWKQFGRKGGFNLLVEPYHAIPLVYSKKERDSHLVFPADPIGEYDTRRIKDPKERLNVTFKRMCKTKDAFRRWLNENFGESIPELKHHDWALKAYLRQNPHLG